MYVDESGTFKSADATNSWCVVAAYVVPEVCRRRVERTLKLLKRRLGCGYQDEVKLKHLSESQLKRLLKELGELEAALFISAIDLGHQDIQVVTCHQANQVQSVRANRPSMLYQGGRASIDDLSGRLERSSPQLYTQMVAQIDLLVNLAAVMRDWEFVRSHDIPGVQLADLLASAWRRVLIVAVRLDGHWLFFVGFGAGTGSAIQDRVAQLIASARHPSRGS
ncbi:DUF3800 domain-containing protein [Stenotrophomonas sp. SAM-B]|uniref:DUF3800 domain-containing protein n=1 Tax=Stenotrophomonas sp. SAM-B TaxID=2729141 RepID=UPI00315A1BD3